MKPDPSAFVSGYCLLALTSLWCHLHKMNRSEENKNSPCPVSHRILEPGQTRGDWQERDIVTRCHEMTSADDQSSLSRSHSSHSSLRIMMTRRPG